MIKKSEKFEWSVAERAAWALPEDMTVSQWADRYRKLDESAAEPGQWRTDRVPYLRGIMDAFTDPAVERIVLKTSTQIGKTQAINNMIGYVVDQDPGPALFIMPTKEDAEDVALHTIQPFVNSNEVITKHTTGNRDDITKKKFVFDRMILYLASAGSPSSLARRSIRYVFRDEINKYPLFSGREADPLKLSSERQRWFWNRKTVDSSTPTVPEGYISREYEKSDKRQYYLPCPHCGHFQTLKWSQIKFPEDKRDSMEIKINRLAWYECVKCEKNIEDRHKQEMLDKGHWVKEGQSIDKKGRITGSGRMTDIAGFFIWAAYSPMLTFSDIVAEFLDSMGDLGAIMNFTNSWLAEEFKEKVQEVTPSMLDKNTGMYSSGTVPENVLVLTAGVDVQQDHFYVVIRGWGYSEESWLIRNGRLETWDQVEDVLFRTKYFRSGGGNNLPVYLVCIDSGYRTSEVYEFCRKRPETRPTKGHNHQKAPWYASKIESHMLTGGRVADGLTLFNIDSSYYKEKVHRLVAVQQGELGAWHLHKETTKDYKDQFCNEVKLTIVNKRTRRRTEEWILKTSGAPNHYLDCEVNAAAAADMINVRYVSREQADELLGKQAANVEKLQEENERASGWLPRKKGWLSR